MPTKKATQEKFDFKKVFKDCYAPKPTPQLVSVPRFSFISVQGCGNPNETDGAYQSALQCLYALSYTIKMSKKIKALKNYVEYVVPPLEGLWWGRENGESKEHFKWQAMIAQPDFVSQEIFEYATQEVAAKKGIDSTKASLIHFEEGLCVQMLHIGSYDDEPQSLAKIKDFMMCNALQNDIGSVQGDFTRLHHEIYLNNPNKTPPHKLKTILRIPVRKIQV